MKKLLLVLTLASISTSAAFAQLGVKVGAQLATIVEEGEGISREDIDKHGIVAPVVGLVFGLNVGDIVTIQPELLYSQSGGRNTYELGGIGIENTYRIGYLELPVLAKLQLGNEDKEGMGFHIAAGPWIGYALHGKFKSKGTVNVERDFTFDDEDDAKRINYGMIGAIGFSITNLEIDLRYNYGFNNLLDNDADNTNDDKPVLQTRGVALTLGLAF